MISMKNKYNVVNKEKLQVDEILQLQEEKVTFKL